MQRFATAGRCVVFSKRFAKRGNEKTDKFTIIKAIFACRAKLLTVYTEVCTGAMVFQSANWRIITKCWEMAPANFFMQAKMLYSRHNELQTSSNGSENAEIDAEREDKNLVRKIKI